MHGVGVLVSGSPHRVRTNDCAASRHACDLGPRAYRELVVSSVQLAHAGLPAETRAFLDLRSATSFAPAALATAFGNGDDRLQLQFAKLFALLSELMGSYGREPQNACKLTSQYDLAPRFLLKAWPATLGKPRRLGSRHGTAHSSACEGEVCVTS